MKKVAEDIYAVIKEYIDNEIKPCVQADGGEIELKAVVGNTIHIAALNECSICPLTEGCYKDWLQQKINSEFEKNYLVKIEIKKPYFWDK